MAVLDFDLGRGVRCGARYRDTPLDHDVSLSNVPSGLPQLLRWASIVPCSDLRVCSPLIVLFSAYRRDDRKNFATTLLPVIATVALPVTALLLNSDRMALISGAVAWVVLPAIIVLGSAMIGPRNHP